MHVLRALRAHHHQSVLLANSAPAAAAAAAAALLPSCSACLSTFSPTLQQSTPQLMRVAQQQQQHNGQNGHDSQGPGSLWGYLGAGGAAAAAGWAAWSYSNGNSSSSSAQIDPMQLARTSPRAQAAVAAACAGPLLHLQHACDPTPAQLQGIAAALEADAAALGPELATGLWGLAMLGADLPQQQLDRLATAALQQMQTLPVYEAIVAAWSIITLCSCSSTSTSSSGLSAAAWQQLLQRLSAAHHRELRDEPSMLYLLHAALQQAAVAAISTPTPAPAAAAAQPLPATSSSSGDAAASPSSSGGSSGGSEGGVYWRAAAADQPHASLQEVLAAVQPLHDKIKKRLATAYREYVPFQPHVEGPLLVVLHIAKSLPRYISAAAAAAAAAAAGNSGSSGGSSGTGPSPLAAVFGGLSGSDAQAAARMIGDPASLGKLKRDLFFRWRAGDLLDRHQQAVNQVAHVLHRHMQLPIQQGADADVVLPSLRAAVFVVDDSQQTGSRQTSLPSPVQQPATTTSSSSSPSSRPSTALAAGAPLLASPLASPLLAASPPSPFTAPFWVEAHVGLQLWMRNRYSAPPGGFACRSCPGVDAAKLRCLEQRGWSVVVLRQSGVEAALGGFKAGRVKVGESYDYRGLERVLRERMGL